MKNEERTNAIHAISVAMRVVIESGRNSIADKLAEKLTDLAEGYDTSIPADLRKTV